MKQVIFVSRDRDQFAELELMLNRNKLNVEWTGTGSDLLSLLSDIPKGEWIDLVVMEESLPDMDAKSLVQDLVPKSPMTNCVVAGSMEEKLFHDAYEGYGVLMQVASSPDKEDAARLETHLNKIKALQC